MDVFAEMYVVAVCYKCGQFLLATNTQKTRCCPHCSARLSMIKTKKVAQVRTAQEASNYIRALKQKGGSEPLG
jgi:DNA-directed RNA polymerase subunit RPC12/RpoP